MTNRDLGDRLREMVAADAVNGCTTFLNQARAIAIELDGTAQALTLEDLAGMAQTMQAASVAILRTTDDLFEAVRRHAKNSQQSIAQATELAQAVSA